MAEAFIKENGKWKTGTMKGLHKRHGLQGPIDDAFMEAFTTIECPETVRTEWAKWMRGDLPSTSRSRKRQKSCPLR